MDKCKICRKPIPEEGKVYIAGTICSQNHISDFIEAVKSLIGLFFPVKFNGYTYWSFSLTVGRVPLGWVIVVIHIITTHLT